jgi:basic membrane lipoprotein Med (substrate-binding protein (PBP1-ABC) superfamily)
VFLTVKAVQDGAWEGGGNSVFGLDQDGVGLGTVSPNANAGDVKATEEVEQRIADGEITDIPTTLGKS